MWTSTIFWRVFSAFAALIVLAAILFGFLVARSEEHELRTQLVDRLRVAAVSVGQLARHEAALESTDELQAFLQQFGKEMGIRLTLVDIGGRVLADSEMKDLAAVEQMESHKDRPEIVAALQSGWGLSERFSSSLKNQLLFYAVRVDGANGPLAVARSSLPVSEILRQVTRGRGMVALFSAVVTLLALAVTFYLLSRIIDPLLELTRAVESTSAGNLRARLEIDDHDEIGMLAKAFNRMNDDLATYIDQLRQRGDQLAAVLGGMVEGVIAVDRRSNILFANESAATLFGFRSEQSQGRPLTAVARDEALHHSVQQAIETRDVVNSEINLRGPAPGTLAVHAAPLPGQPCPGVVLVFYDITRLRRLESLRQEFVANVSHELKTPLSAIKAYAETLLAGAIHDQTNNVHFVQRIEDQADRLHQLILDLLSLARIESGQQAFEIEVVDVAQVVSLCLGENRRIAEARSIDLKSTPPPEPVGVLADDEGVRQILENLVSNAIKYTPAGGSVTVRWRKDADACLLEVVDTGIGVEPEHFTRLFERFYRVDKARSRELGGTGLGLSIVKHLAQFFGGNVGVQSEPDKGSTFWVRLPLAPETR
jgi:two-component system phosphate regulon sensor histidine kinase PhoR